MWDTVTEFLGLPWVAHAIALIGVLVALIGILVRRSQRKSEIEVMRNIERNTSKQDAENDKPSPPADDRERETLPQAPATPQDCPDKPKADRLGPDSERNASKPDTAKEGKTPPPADKGRETLPWAPSTPQDRSDRPEADRHARDFGGRRIDAHRSGRFTQRQFDHELLKILEEQRESGRDHHIVISRDLHRRVVGGSNPNRMPMACEAMWKRWNRQGGKEENIIHTTKSGRSSTIEIKYDLSVLD